jgi:hypothetical protein
MSWDRRVGGVDFEGGSLRGRLITWVGDLEVFIGLGLVFCRQRDYFY